MHASEFARRCDSPSGARAVTGGSSTHYEMAIGPVAGCFHRSIKIAGATALPSARLLSSRVPVGRPTFRVASPSVELSEGCHSALLGAPRVSWGENDTGRPLLTRRCFVLLVIVPRSRIYSLRGEALMSRR